MNFKKMFILTMTFIFLLSGCTKKTELKKKTDTPNKTETSCSTEETNYSSPVAYSSLSFYGDKKTFIPSQSANQSLVTVDIAPFYESYTENCDFIEGVITNVYEKCYEYTLPATKSEGTAHAYTISVIYEFEIEKSRRGKHKAGERILIEDMQIGCGEQFYMKKGHKYLVPIENAGDDIAIFGLNADKAKGETKRQTPYTTVYPYHPQIEITKNGYYFFSNDWESLAAENALKVTDVEFDGGSVYYKDRMLLLDSESFEENIKKLLSK
ncbi:MAG: hypothetical protein IKU52_00850 [Clostridia bacterium]|nr:hypothetical protein [Clostridia bacterium]